MSDLGWITQPAAFPWVALAFGLCIGSFLNVVIHRLPIIMESLTTAYDLVIVECGPADADGIRRLVAPGTEILVSMVEAESEVAGAVEKLKDSGYFGLSVVTPAGYRPRSPAMRNRSAA